jgi:uncharacterized protein YoxC
LQAALLCASVAVVVFVAACLPMLMQLCRHAERMAQTLADLKAETSLLVQDTRTLVQNVNELSNRANQQCDDIERVVHTMRGWSDRVDRVVVELGTLVEPPLMAVARNAHIWRKGVSRFVKTFLNQNGNKKRKTEAEDVS